jgi:hypothetical protein
MALIDKATNSVNLSYQGSLDALEAAAAKAQADYDQRVAAVASLYGGLGSQLGTVGSDYAAAAPAIADGYLANLGSVANLFGGTTGMMPGAEAQAGNLMGNAIGAGTMGLLAEGSQRNLNYNASAVRQSGIDSTNTQKALAMDLQQFLDNVALQRTQIEREKAMAIQAELDRLRQQRFQNRMTRRQFRLQRRSANQQYRMNQFQLQQARQAAAGGGGGGGGGGGVTGTGGTTINASTTVYGGRLDAEDRAWVESATKEMLNSGASLSEARAAVSSYLKQSQVSQETINNALTYLTSMWGQRGGNFQPGALA